MQNVYVYSELERKLELPNDKNVILENNLFKPELSFSAGDIFVSYDHQTPLQFRLEFYNIPYNSLVIIADNDNLVEILNQEDEHFTEDYNIFSGKKIEVLKKETKLEIIRNIKILINIMYQMLEAGYLEFKNYQKIDDWILSFEEPILKIFKIYHDIETSNGSVDFEEEFLINPQFRNMLLIMFMKIISNFMINNNLITISEVAKIGDWENISVWKVLRKKIKLLK